MDDREGEREDKDDVEDESLRLQLEAGVLSRAACAAVDIPIAGRRTLRCRAPLPLAELHVLDAHRWASEVDVLSKWARGAAVGALANSITDAMFVPCSPPRPRAYRHS